MFRNQRSLKKRKKPSHKKRKKPSHKKGKKPSHKKRNKPSHKKRNKPNHKKRPQLVQIKVKKSGKRKKIIIWIILIFKTKLSGKHDHLFNVTSLFTIYKNNAQIDDSITVRLKLLKSKWRFLHRNLFQPKELTNDWARVPLR